MSTETTDGVAMPEFKSVADTDWSNLPVLPTSGDTDKIAIEIDSDGYVNVAEVVEKGLGIADVSVLTPSPLQLVQSLKSRQKPEPSRQLDDPDKFLLQAKALVVQNYNDHRDPRRAVLTMDLVYITLFSKVSQNWKAFVGSTAVRGLIWEVTFNGDKNEAYIDVYKKLSHVKIPFGK